MLLDAPRIPGRENLLRDAGGGMAVVGVELGKHCFPGEVKALANGGVRGIVIIGVPLLGHPLEQGVIHALRDQEVHRFLEAGKGITNPLVLTFGQPNRCDLDRLESFQRTPRLTGSCNPKEIGVSSIRSRVTHKFNYSIYNPGPL